MVHVSSCVFHLIRQICRSVTFLSAYKNASIEVSLRRPGVIKQHKHSIWYGMCCLMTPGLSMDGWMNGVLGHFYALSRLNWAGDNLG